jgi:hypothetical protein
MHFRWVVVATLSIQKFVLRSAATPKGMSSYPVGLVSNLVGVQGSETGTRSCERRWTHKQQTESQGRSDGCRAVFRRFLLVATSFIRAESKMDLPV